MSVRSERSRIRRSTIVCQSAFRFPPGVPAERRATDGYVCRESLRDLGGPESRPEFESRLPAAFRKPQGVREGVGQLGAATEKAAVAEVGVTCDLKQLGGGELRGSWASTARPCPWRVAWRPQSRGPAGARDRADLCGARDWVSSLQSGCEGLHLWASGCGIRFGGLWWRIIK